MSAHAAGRLSGDSAGEQLLWIRTTEAALSVQLEVTVLYEYRLCVQWASEPALSGR